MPQAINIPRINSNDDTLRIATIHVSVGDKIDEGDEIFDLETNKSTESMESEVSGYVLRICCEVGDEVEVGSVGLWIGESADEEIPQEAPAPKAEQSATSTKPTIKALELLKKYALSEKDVKASGDRLSAADVEAFIKSNPQAVKSEQPADDQAHESRNLDSFEKAMLQTITNSASGSCGYMEIEYNVGAWQEFSKEFSESRGLMFDPLIGLMAYALVKESVKHEKLNAYLSGEKLFLPLSVNLGFAVDVVDKLYLVVIHEAQSLSPDEFLNQLALLQRKTITQTLSQQDTSGATIGFTSLAKHNIARHMPILAPKSSLMLAHCATRTNAQSEEVSCLGASYDHRVLTGSQVAKLLNSLSSPTIFAGEK